MGGMGAAVLVTIGTVLVENWHARLGGLANVQGRAIPPEHL